MAVTRREFVTTLGLLAGAVGMGQAELAKVVEAFGHASPSATLGAGADLYAGAWTNKPKVIWVHGAECTGCSTSLLSLFEDATGIAVPNHPSLGNISTATALNVVAGGGVENTGDAAAELMATTVDHPHGHRTLNHAGLNVDGSAYAVNIADVLIDFIDLQYHETVMAMGGDSAYAYLANEMARNDSAPFVLVVEGAVQAKEKGGYWGKTGTAGVSAPWCSIAKDGRLGKDVDVSFDDVVEVLASKAACLAVVAIGQCATFGGYPACIGPDLIPGANGSVKTTKSMTEAKGVYDFLTARGLVGDGAHGVPGVRDKVINVPGCPANPWWFTLSVVAFLVDLVTVTDTTDGALGILGVRKDTTASQAAHLQIVGGVDSQRRLTAVYGHLLHGKFCPRYPKYAARIFASKPGDDGCLKNIGCKGLSTMSLCGRHGWNAAQPQNTAAKNAAVDGVMYSTSDGTSKIGGFCMTAGAPCMGCTEKGYPDAFTPFVTL
jgi:Ni,Fe-hydrogenase I small subunit